MKKAVSAVLIAASLVFILSSCSGHFLNKTAQGARELTAAEKLLSLCPWQSRDGGETELVFSDDLTGRMGATPFEWRADGNDVTLRFFPASAIGAERELTLDADSAAPSLDYDGAPFAPGLIIPAAPAETEPAEPRPTEEELLGRAIADYALGFLGWNYKYGGKTPETGFDCSGLVYYIYEQHGYHLERVAAEQAKQGVEIAHDALMPGDILGFYTSGKYVGHIGIYVGNGYYVHAMGSAYGVVLTSLDDKYSQRDYTARRIIGCDELLAENVNAVQ